MEEGVSSMSSTDFQKFEWMVTLSVAYEVQGTSWFLKFGGSWNLVAGDNDQSWSQQKEPSEKMVDLRLDTMYT